MDMLPILGYIILGGKCRTCGHKISARYIVVESLTGLLITWLFVRYGISMAFFWYSILTCVLLVITFIDYDTMTIPNGIVVFCLIVGFVKLCFEFNTGGLLDSLYGFVAGGGVFLLIYFVSGGRMGGGDIKLMAVLGLWLGLRNIMLTMLIAFNVGAVISLILIGAGIKGRKDMIPFGPFIGIGAYIAILYGTEIIDWYTRVFLF